VTMEKITVQSVLLFFLLARYYYGDQMKEDVARMGQRRNAYRILV
jgi:hypothetical protein